MKRTKQVQIMVDTMNQRFKENHIASEHEEGASWLSTMLDIMDTYEGFNIFYDKQVTDTETVQCLLVYSTPEEIQRKGGYIQFY